MGAYQLLYSVTVEHMYFANNVCKSLQFVPTQATVNLLYKSGLLLKVSENRLSVFFEDDRLDVLQMHAEDNFVFTFKVFSKDPNFSLYTFPEIPAQHTILYFDNQHLANDTVGRFLLHSGSTVSNADYLDLNADLISGDLESRDCHVRPCFIIKIVIQKDAQLLSLNQQSGSFRQFHISFASKKTFWKYYLMGNLSGRELYIADMNNEIEFEEIGSAVLPGNRNAKMLRSTSAIQMQEKPLQCLQLMEFIDLRGKIVIKRLPNASIHQINGEMVQGKMKNISEIYIH
ncbi:hypothetical protein [Nitrosomonas aestuarii]|uniref:hypothetical protein n=1 Tax=Nitrosomonas aestuarii TaxID=52441 RepID=UPI000D2FFC23|nr:hypothetical protein [Nitrosomonas aestuarii]PTN11657.1 hypothetical protein C8R11_10876 [Nitrosomonas aestuarii]